MLGGDSEDHIHNEYFHLGEDGLWEWWERLDVVGTDEYVTERTKCFTEETFIEEVLQPMVDHVGGCSCTQVVFHPLNEEGTLPTWLAYTPERAEPPLPHIETDDPVLHNILYGNSCYSSKWDDCHTYRVSTRTGKQRILELYREQKQREALLATYSKT